MQGGRGCGMEFYRRIVNREAELTRKIVKRSKRVPDNSEAMLIFVKLPSNKSITLTVESFDKIASVKEKIEDQERFPCARQCLYFSGKRLNDRETLAAYNIINDSTLDLRLRVAEAAPCNIVCSEKRPIFVKLPSNKSLYLILERYDKIATIKQKIEEKEHFRCARQCLYFSGKRLDDHETLATYNIFRDSTLHLKLWAEEVPCDIEIQILPCNRTVSMRIQQGLRITVRELKDSFYRQEGIECEDIYLDDDFTGDQLGEDETLEACGVPERSLVVVQSPGMSIGGTSPSFLSRFTRKPRASRALVDAAFKEASNAKRTLPGLEDLEPLEVQNAPELKSNQGQVCDIETAIATMLHTHKDCERKLSLILDEKNKIQTNLLQLQSKYPKLLSEVLAERNQLQRDLTELQNEFPRRLSHLVDEKNKLQQHLNELQYEFLQMSLVLDENAKLQRDSDKLQKQLDTTKIELAHERERSLCSICFDRPRDTLVFSCLHLHFCSSCLLKHQERTNTCPTCRGFISGKLICNVSIS